MFASPGQTYKPLLEKDYSCEEHTGLTKTENARNRCGTWPSWQFTQEATGSRLQWLLLLANIILLGLSLSILAWARSMSAYTDVPDPRYTHPSVNAEIKKTSSYCKLL